MVHIKKKKKAALSLLLLHPSWVWFIPCTESIEYTYVDKDNSDKVNGKAGGIRQRYGERGSTGPKGSPKGNLKQDSRRGTASFSRSPLIHQPWKS